VNTNDTEGAMFFLLDDVPWPDEGLSGTAPKELVEAAERAGARRKFLARGEGGFHSQYSELPAGFTVPIHSHDHNEVIVMLGGSCTMLSAQRAEGGFDGPTLEPGDSMVLIGGVEYGFTAGSGGMRFMTIRTGKATVTLA